MATWSFNPENFVQTTDDVLVCNTCDWSQPVVTKSAPSGGQMKDSVATGRVAADHLKDHNAATVDADWSPAGTRWTAHEKV